MALLERTSLLGQLTDVLGAAVRSNGRLVLLSGEAGIGKSALTRAFTENVERRVDVLSGACEDLSTAEPLGAVLELLRSSQLAIGEEKRGAALFSSMLDHFAAQPRLVIIEDLHWADDATLDFVRYVGRRIAKTPLLLLVTARDDTADAQSRLRRALVNVPPEIYTHIKIPLLSKAATIELATALGQDGAAIYALTNGNPFLATEVARHPTGVPDTVRAALMWKADTLSPAGRYAIEAASIFPRRVEAWLLAAMCGKDGLHGISECVRCGLLTSEDGFYSFRHEIARRAIDLSLLPIQRAELNALAMHRLQEREPQATPRLVHHAMEADDIGALIVLAPRAALEAAQAGAHRQAAKHYETALAHANAYDPAARAELCEKAAFELQLVGQVHKAIALFATARDLHLERADLLRAGDALRWISRLSYNVGDRAGADKFGLEAITTLEPLGNGPELAMAYASFALITALKDDNDNAIRWAERTLELGQTLGRQDIVADAHGTLGIATQWRDLQASREHFQSGLDIALKLDQPDITARIYGNSSCTELNVRDSAGARRWLEAGIAFCQDRDIDSWVLYMGGWLAELLVREGEWTKARRLAEQVLERPSDSLVLRFPTNLALARLRIRQGDPTITYSENGLTFETEPQRLLIYAPIIGERAWIERNGEDDALALLEKAAAVAAEIGNIWAAGEIAYWRLKLGAELETPPRVAPPFQRLFSGDWQGAAEAWARVPAPYEQALALLEGDAASQRSGLAILDRLGANAAAARFRMELRKRGVRSIARGPRASTRENAAGLTARELEVLTQIEMGHSNAEIAAHLGVSAKTVDHHVSAILKKLDAPSRLAAVARARRQGIITP